MAMMLHHIMPVNPHREGTPHRLGVPQRVTRRIKPVNFQRELVTIPKDHNFDLTNRLYSAGNKSPRSRNALSTRLGAVGTG
jgi:hypothetical protein